MPAFTLAIFLSAFLLFIVQPMLAKKLLPWFGGLPTVWLSNMLFFQMALLLGYLYAFVITKLANIRLQVAIHFILLTLSFSFLPLVPQETFIALPLWPPIVIFTILTATLFLPGIVISASSPLLQYWYCKSYQTDFPYRYYALSNFGSLLGLLAYPFLLEPLFGLSTQLSLWSGLYVIYALSSLACLRIVFRARHSFSPTALALASPPEPLKRTKVFIWLVLTFLSSALLLSTTQVTMQNVAGFPFLWVLPLSLYLITFIITFSYPKAYIRWLWLSLFGLLMAVIFCLSTHHQLHLALQVLVYSVLLFSGCMLCHGELIQAKPSKEYLTAYYLAMAGGGVLGGIFVNIIAPLFFSEWWDFYFSLFAILIYVIYISPLQLPFKQIKRWQQGMGTGALAVLSLLLSYHLYDTKKEVILSERNFFGSFEVIDRNPLSKEFHQRQLRNGNILHGVQYLKPSKRLVASSYYGPTTGLYLAFDFERDVKASQAGHQGLRIGVVGLGTGTMAALTKVGDYMRFFEIDKAITQVAKNYFYYLADAPAAIDIVNGDARIALAHKFAASGSDHYDILAIDAFNGDAIPVHLLTLEAVNIYLSHLAPQGILAFHISSRYVDLFPPLQALAASLGLHTYLTHNDSDPERWISASSWLLMTREVNLGSYLFEANALKFTPRRTDKVWTDDYNYLLDMIRW